MNQKLIAFNLKQRKLSPALELKSGDVIKVFRKIKEGSKERLQAFQGTVIAIKGGQSSSKTITVRKVSFGVGVELVLPLTSPQIQKIEFVKHTRARRAKLYFVRDKSVKVLSKKLKEVPGKPASLKEVDETPATASEPETETAKVSETTETKE
jgi:large subunit ribosomal protein L19